MGWKIGRKGREGIGLDGNTGGGGEARAESRKCINVRLHSLVVFSAEVRLVSWPKGATRHSSSKEVILLRRKFVCVFVCFVFYA